MVQHRDGQDGHEGSQPSQGHVQDLRNLLPGVKPPLHPGKQPALGAKSHAVHAGDEKQMHTMQTIGLQRCTAALH